MGAWSAGKMFEAALAKVAAQARAGAVTTKMVIEGMQSLKGDTLGGLSAVPLTFKAGAHVVPDCYFVTLIDRRGTSDLTKGRPQCL
jgi:branched-chain amino acid transport system substrate-binding protein